MCRHGLLVALVMLLSCNCVSGESGGSADAGKPAGGEPAVTAPGSVAAASSPALAAQPQAAGKDPKVVSAVYDPSVSEPAAKLDPNAVAEAGKTEEKPPEAKQAGGEQAKPRPAADPKEEEIWKRVDNARPAEVERPDDLTEGQMRVPDKDGKLLALPLAHTSVEAEVSGFLGRVWVTQFFTNPLDHPIEAIYVFPLPNEAAVDDMEMVIGDRVIKGVMKKRDEARKIYEEAKQQGKTASLLEQERPNIFTQSVANILPGDRIRVRIRYVQDLRYEDGGYTFVFPMVVGPRYIPGTPTGKQAGGWAPDTNQVPDASRITPPVLKPGERSGHDIDVTLTINSGVKVEELKSISHDIKTQDLGDNKVQVTLAPYDTIPNKDFTVRYRTAGEQIEIATLFHKSDLGGYFMLLFQPEAQAREAEVMPRELVFVVDCSGSQSGTPIAKSKEAVKKALKTMRPEDKFQIITFSNAANGFSPNPVDNTPENVKWALQFVDQLEGEGGTEMMTGIRAALDYPKDPKRVRIVAFFTDGYVGNETEILEAIKQKIGDARLFSFGIGSSVNRYLLDQMAEVGRGYVTYVRQDESADQAVERFYKRIESPVLVDVGVKVEGNVKIQEVYPSPIPDLFVGQPLVVHGRFEGSGQATFVVTGRQGNGKFEKEIHVTFPKEEKENGVLATLWARTKIKYFMDRMFRGEDPDLVKQVTDLAITFRIMSQYTAFVAVEEQIRNVGGKMETVQVPVQMPEGVSYKGVFGQDGDTGGGYAPAPTSAMRMRQAPAGYGGAVAGVKEEEKAAAEEPAKKADDSTTAAGPAACTLAVDNLVVLQGPLPEKDVRDALANANAALAAELGKALSAEVGSGDLEIRVTFEVGTDGKITVKSFTADGTSSSALTQARKAFEGKAEKMSFAAESSPTLVKVTFRLACR